MVTSKLLATIAPQYLPEPHASLLNGILLGISIKNTGEFYKETIDAGLIHLVVVSGSNISLLSMMVEKLLIRLSKPLKNICIMVTIVLFTLLVGLQPPVVRASIMSCMALFGSLTGRRVSTLYTLGMSAFISIILWPEWVSSLSFYLTYLSTSSIILFAKPKSTTRAKLSPIRRVFLYLLGELRTGVAAQIFILPLIYFSFGRFSLVSIFSTIAVSWTITPIMILGFLMILFKYIYPSGINVTIHPLYYLLDVIVVTTHLFS